VLNHLFFWTWFLRAGLQNIVIPCARESIEIFSRLSIAIARFGIGTDKKTLTAILKSEYDVNWQELEQEATEQPPQERD
jgi:DNA transposition AAA+ family ATPase